MRHLTILKMLLIVVSLSFNLKANAQFTLTPNGLISSENQKDYVVLNFEGKSTHDLYIKTLVYLSEMMELPNEAISKIEDKAISLRCHSDEAFKAKSGIVSVHWDVDYSLKFLFKDGKVRVNSPNLIEISRKGIENKKYIMGLTSKQVGLGSRLGGNVCVFKKNGKVRSSSSKVGLEKYFNNFLADLSKHISTDADTDW